MKGVVALSDARFMLRLPPLWIETCRIPNTTAPSAWHNRPKIILGMKTFGPQLMWCLHNHEYIHVDYRRSASWPVSVLTTRVGCGFVACYVGGRGANFAMTCEATIRREQLNAPLSARMLYIVPGTDYCPWQWRTQEFYSGGVQLCSGGGGGVNKFILGQRAEITGIWGGSPLVRGSAQFANEWNPYSY
jgi:hypothetical protein